MKRIITVFGMLTCFFSFGQDVTETFNSTRIINAHSTEVLGNKMWEYRIEHRFGDFAGTNGGVQQAFGFDQAADIRMAMEYGFANKWMAGIGRSKGIGRPYTSLLDGFLKGRLLTQNAEKKMPVSLAIVGNMFATYMKEVDDPQSVAYFNGDFTRRLSYSTQIIVTRKFGDRLSLAIMPTYTHRNYVANDDENGIFSLGVAANLKINKSIGVIAEYFYNIEPSGLRPLAQNSFALGFEFVTNGHNFHINLTNARGFGDVQYIALTQEEWLKGQFRLGFSISRNFKIRRK